MSTLGAVTVSAVGWLGLACVFVLQVPLCNVLSTPHLSPHPSHRSRCSTASWRWCWAWSTVSGGWGECCCHIVATPYGPAGCRKRVQRAPTCCTSTCTPYSHAAGAHAGSVGGIQTSHPNKAFGIVSSGWLGSIAFSSRQRSSNPCCPRASLPLLRSSKHWAPSPFHTISPWC